MSTPLIIVKPVQITEAMLVSSSVPETDYTEYSAGTTYGLGARVRVTSLHKVYESAAAGNVGNSPASYPDKWIEVGPTNRWRAFDTSNSTQTAQSVSMSYVLRPGQAVNAFAALNVEGAISIRVRVTHPTLGTIYDKTTDLTSLPAESGFWSWCFGSRSAPPLLVATDLPGIPGCDVLIDISGTSALAVGVLMVGERRTVGISVAQGASISLRDYSKYIDNGFGDYVLKQGNYAKDVKFSVSVAVDQIDDTFDYLTTLRATPCLFIGSSRRRILTTFGFIQDVPTQMSNSAVSDIDFTIKALT
jgi:hypothetical protein